MIILGSPPRPLRLRAHPRCLWAFHFFFPFPWGRGRPPEPMGMLQDIGRITQRAESRFLCRTHSIIFWGADGCREGEAVQDGRLGQGRAAEDLRNKPSCRCKSSRNIARTSVIDEARTRRLHPNAFHRRVCRRLREEPGMASAIPSFASHQSQAHTIRLLATKTNRLFRTASSVC